MTQPVSSMASGPLRTPTPGADLQLVINLVSSTTPMSLVKPAFKELERFTFFVSRRREDGRERFRLHMGYFTNRAEAEQWLSVVRTVYPGAWISDAPGKKLRGTNNNAAPVARTGVTQTVAALDGAPTNAADSNSHTQTLTSISGLQPVVTRVQAPTVAEPPVLGPARLPLPLKPVVAASARAAKESTVKAAPNKAVVARAPARAPLPPMPPTPATDSLSDSQVLKMLERSGSENVEDSAIRDVPMLRQLDSYSLKALRKDISSNLPVPFAVQLDWSTNAIDIAKIPPLAIFKAYTLYTVGCLHEGRKWYGLRLGFFSDAISAKQVAQYVRSEFKSVSVVPVSTRERSQADATGGIDIEKTAPPRHGGADASEEITLLPDGARPNSPAKAPAVPKPAAPAATVPVNNASARVMKRGSSRIGGNRTLEETLEILGASQLTIENAKGERLNITGRHARVDSSKTGTFSKLLDRLADRLRT
jgi:hypothetical protein